MRTRTSCFTYDDTSCADVAFVLMYVRRRGEDGRDLAAMARDEVDELVQQLRRIEPSIVKNIMPRDSADSLNVVLEVRAGTGGEEASLFASELFHMYEVFCRARGWRWELLSLSRSEIGGFTSAQANVSGRISLLMLWR